MDAFPSAPPRSARRRPSPPINEYLVHVAWFDQRVDAASLRTVDGRPVRVLTPGHWSLEGGPDFRGAELWIGGTRVTGDVEVHRDAADWHRHGHDRDPAYARIVLHVALAQDRPDAWVTASDGRLIPQVILGPCVEPPLPELVEQLAREGYPRERFAGVGLCHRAASGRRVLREFLGRFLDRAGDVRFAEAARRFGSELDGGTDAEEAFHRGLFEALGYRANAGPFRRLAELLPRARLAAIAAGCAPEERTAALEAVLLDRAGLAGGTAAGDVPAPAGALTRADWALGGCRPANAPPRRIAGAARLLARSLATDGLYAGLEATLAAAGPGPWGAEPLADLLAALAGPLRIAAAAGPALIGRERAHLILLNIFLPLAAARARRTGDLHLGRAADALYAAFPALGPNHILRFGTLRLFGPRGDRGGVIDSSRRQQGLLALFYSHCDQGLRGCRTCPLFRALGGSPAPGAGARP